MDVRQIIEQNPWWEDKSKIYEDEKVREALEKTNKISYDFKEENTLIIGPRQVGKTTFMKLFIKHLIDKDVDPKRILYFSCEMIRNSNEIIEVVRFLDRAVEGKKYLFFDEVTFIPDWQRAVKYILDSPLKKDKVAFVTGSSSIALKKETFPGRDIKTSIFLPLSFKEFCRIFGSENLRREIEATGVSSFQDIEKNARRFIFYFNEIDRLFDHYIKCGGFPRAIYELLESGKIREETFETYWKWLIADIAKIERSERIATAVLLGVIKNYGSRFSLNSIAKEMEIGSHVTVRDYMEILENLFVLRSIFPEERGRETFRKMRKAYFIDPFLFHVFKKYIMGVSIKEEEVPGLVEGIVCEHLIRRFGRVCYYYKKREVDFCLGDTGIEVKWQREVDYKDFPKVPFRKKILLSMNQFEVMQNLIIVPAPIFLLML